MKKVIALVAVFALFSLNASAQEVKKDKKAKAKTEKTCSTEEKKSCSADKKSCCAAKADKKA